LMIQNKEPRYPSFPIENPRPILTNYSNSPLVL
jgi:hypothetical protein